MRPKRSEGGAVALCAAGATATKAYEARQQNARARTRDFSTKAFNMARSDSPLIRKAVQSSGETAVLRAVSNGCLESIAVVAAMIGGYAAGSGRTSTGFRLSQTVKTLQGSVLGLLDRMIDPGRDVIRVPDQARVPASRAAAPQPIGV